MIKAVTFDLGNTLLRQDNIDWKKLEKAGFLNHISVFSKQNLKQPTLNEWSGLYERLVGVFEKTIGKHHHEIPAERIFQIMHEYYNIPASISTATLLSTFFYSPHECSVADGSREGCSAGTQRCKVPVRRYFQYGRSGKSCP